MEIALTDAKGKPISKHMDDAIHKILNRLETESSQMHMRRTTYLTADVDDCIANLVEMATIYTKEADIMYGKTLGRAEGKAAGRAAGRTQGIIEGEKKARDEFTRKLLNRGFNEDEVYEMGWTITLSESDFSRGIGRQIKYLEDNMDSIIEKEIIERRAAHILEGKDLGRSEAHAEGKAEAIEKGKAEGQRRANKQFVQKLIHRGGFDHDEIAELTGLSTDEVKKEISLAHESGSS